MKPGNVGVAEATARLSGYISGQKGKAWIVKDLGLEPLAMPAPLWQIDSDFMSFSGYIKGLHRLTLHLVPQLRILFKI